MIDVGPTILEAAGCLSRRTSTAIEQQPMHGTSFLYSLDDAGAAERHTQQYFEILGNRAMYKDGWWLSWDDAAHPMEDRPRDAEAVRAGGLGPEDDPVELYYLPDDFSQANNLADQHPEKVEELQELFWKEAERYDVLPLLGGLTGFFGIRRRCPRGPSSRTTARRRTCPRARSRRSTTTRTRSAPSSRSQRAAPRA